MSAAKRQGFDGSVSRAPFHAACQASRAAGVPYPPPQTNTRKHPSQPPRHTHTHSQGPKPPTKTTTQNAYTNSPPHALHMHLPQALPGGVRSPPAQRGGSANRVGKRAFTVQRDVRWQRRRTGSGPPMMQFVGNQFTYIDSATESRGDQPDRHGATLPRRQPRERNFSKFDLILPLLKKTLLFKDMKDLYGK